MTQLEKLIKEMANNQYFAVLSTVDEGQPYSNLVSFAMTTDLKSLIFVTDRNTRKYRNIKKHNKVALIIDNRSNQPSDIKQAIAITVIGDAFEEVEEKSNLQAILLDRHPQLQEFVNDTHSALMLVKVNEYIVASFNKIQRFVIS